MDVIENSLGNGTIDIEDDDIDHKPTIIRANLEESAATENLHSVSLAATKLPLRMALDNFSNAPPGTVFRILPVKIDATVDAITDADVPGTPILSSHLATNDASEPRLTFISTDSSNDNNSTVVVSGGQLLVISESPNVTTPSRPFLPRTTDVVINQKFSTAREEKRRVTHNEVERRRRDKINSWICTLAKILPEDAELQSKSSQVSKGGILAKACEYIEQLNNDKKGLSEKLNLMEKEYCKRMGVMRQELEILKNENNTLKNENARLKANIHSSSSLTS